MTNYTKYFGQRECHAKGAGNDKKIIIYLKDNAPNWLREAVREAHDNLLPDDYIYEWCFDACFVYDDYEGNTQRALDNIEPQTYNYELLEWLSSHTDRVYLVDEALQEFGFTDLILAIAHSQVSEKTRVYEIIFNAIKKQGIA